MMRESGDPSTPEEPSNPAGKPTDWDVFVASDTAEARCRTWLALICGQVAGVKTGIILIEHPADHAYVPIAAWPNENETEIRQSGERLGPVI